MKNLAIAEVNKLQLEKEIYKLNEKYQILNQITNWWLDNSRKDIVIKNTEKFGNNKIYGNQFDYECILGLFQFDSLSSLVKNEFKSDSVSLNFYS